MTYKVVITPPAQRRLDSYVSYTFSTLKNKEAARAILADAKATKKVLQRVAGSNALCDDLTLNKYGYRKQFFLKHRYVMIYRIHNNMVIVEGMYHELQDYESIFIRERNI